VIGEKIYFFTLCFDLKADLSFAPALIYFGLGNIFRGSINEA
jgi:hypothetical protein